MKRLFALALMAGCASGPLPAEVNDVVDMSIDSARVADSTPAADATQLPDMGTVRDATLENFIDECSHAGASPVHDPDMGCWICAENDMRLCAR